MIRLLEFLIAAFATWLKARLAPPAKATPNLEPPDRSHDTISIGTTTDAEGLFTVPVQLAHTWLDRPCYIVGGSGGGKTNFVMVLIDYLLARLSADTSANGSSARASSLVVIDFRQDLLFRVMMAAVRHGGNELAKRTYIFEFSRLDELFFCFNLLSASCGIGDPYTRSGLLLAIIESLSLSWGTLIQECGRHTLFVLACAGRSLADAPRLLSDASFRASLLRQVDDELTLLWFAQYDAAKRPQDLSGPFLNKLSHFLTRPEIRRWVSSDQSTSFSEILNGEEGMLILIGLSADTLSEPVARLLGGLLLGAITQVILARTSVPEADRKPVKIICDEFQNICNLPTFPVLLSEGRRYKAAGVYLHQFADQLGTIRPCVIGNSALHAYFQTDAAQATVLAPNVTSELSALAVKELLVSQPSGHCVLIRRGEPSIRLRVHHYRDPADVTPAMVEAFRQACFAKVRPVPSRALSQPAVPTPPSLTTQESEVLHVSRPDID